MVVFQTILLVFLICCAIAVSVSKDILNAVLVYMSFGLVMSIIWVTLESPDLAITEAAVGAGVTSLLFFITLKKIRAIKTLQEPDNLPQDRAIAESGDESEADALIWNRKATSGQEVSHE